MRTVYLDSDFKCHIQSGEGMIEVDTPFFDGKCDAYIEGYRLIPEGQSWRRDDGTVFYGEMVAPWREHDTLAAAQAEYEKAQAEAADMQGALDYLFGGETV